MLRKTSLIVFLALFGSVTGLPAQDKLPPQAERTFSDPAAYVPDLTEKPASSELRDLVPRYVADKWLLERFYSVSGSKTRREKLAAFCSAWLGALPKIDFDRLSRDGQADYILLKNRIEYDLARLARDERIASAVAPLAPFVEDMAKLQEDRQELRFIDAAEAAAAVEKILAEVKAVQAGVESGTITAPAALAVKAVRFIGRMKSAMEEWFNFYNGYDPAFTAKVPAPYEALGKALGAYLETLRIKLAGLPPGTADAGGRRGDEDFEAPLPEANDPKALELKSRPIVGDPVGREGLLEDLKGEMIVYSPEELIEIGNREYAWTVAEMKKASREMGFGDDWRAALEKVKQAYVARGRQPELVRNLEIQAETFVREHDLVTIPPILHDTWRMEMMPPSWMMTAPFFLGGESIMVSYPLEGMSEATARMIMKGNSPHLSHATVFHELIPGHGQNGFMAERYNAYRNAAFNTSFYGEGWTLFWEMLLWDLGFHATPEDRIGALFWRMHRAARVIFTMNYQMGFWSPHRCVDFLVSNGHELFTAEGEVRAHVENFGSLYQASYLVGALQVRALYKELVTDGKALTTRQFTDAYLRAGSMPIEVLRALLGNKPLNRDFKAGWKFYGDVPAAEPSR